LLVFNTNVTSKNERGMDKMLKASTLVESHSTLTVISTNLFVTVLAISTLITVALIFKNNIMQAWKMATVSLLGLLVFVSFGFINLQQHTANCMTPDEFKFDYCSKAITNFNGMPLAMMLSSIVMIGFSIKSVSVLLNRQYAVLGIANR